MISRRTIEREADQHIELGRLLRVERKDDKKQAVQEIMNSPMGILQKIDKIRKIDSGEQKQARNPQLELENRQHYVRLQQDIKAPHKQISLFGYLVYEYRRLKTLGRKSHVFEAKLFPPGIHINPHITGFLVKNLQIWSIELSRYLALVTDHGWLYLPKHQYNLLVVLRKLCDRLSKSDFVHLNYRDRNLIDKLRSLEIPFLVLLYRQEYLEEILAGLEIVFQKLGRSQEIDEIHRLVLRILTPETTLPSLCYFLLGLNILKCRQLLSLSNLVRTGLGDIVYAAEFDCDPTVHERIEAHVEKIIAGIQSAHERLFEVRRFNHYIPYDEEGSFDPLIISQMYESVESGQDFNQDLNHIGLFAARLLRTFDTVFFPLLNGTVIVRNVGKATIFARTFFEVALDKLRSNVEHLDKSSLALVNFGYDQYIKIKHSETAALPQEKEIVQLIDEGLSLLVEIGNTLGQVLELSKTNVSADTAQLQPIVLQGKSIPLPYAEKKLKSQGFLNDKTVFQAIESAITLCFSSGVYLHDWYARMLLGKETKFEEEIQKQLRQLERIVPPIKIEELKSRYS